MVGKNQAPMAKSSGEDNHDREGSDTCGVAQVQEDSSGEDSCGGCGGVGPDTHGQVQEESHVEGQPRRGRNMHTS